MVLDSWKLISCAYLASWDPYSYVKLVALITVPVGLSFMLYLNYIVSVNLMTLTKT